MRLIKRRPGATAKEILLHVGRSRATVMRYIAELKAEGEIEFRGAPKTGGYYACASQIIFSFSFSPSIIIQEKML